MQEDDPSLDAIDSSAGYVSTGADPAAMQADIESMLRVADVRWGIFFRAFTTLEWVYWILIIASTVGSAAATLLTDQGWARICSGVSAVLIAVLGVTQLQTR